MNQQGLELEGTGNRKLNQTQVPHFRTSALGGSEAPSKDLTRVCKKGPAPGCLPHRGTNSQSALAGGAVTTLNGKTATGPCQNDICLTLQHPSSWSWWPELESYKGTGDAVRVGHFTSTATDGKRESIELDMRLDYKLRLEWIAIRKKYSENHKICLRWHSGMGRGIQMNMAESSDWKKNKAICVYSLNNLLWQWMNNYDFRSK